MIALGSFFHGVETKKVTIGSRGLRSLENGTIAVVGTAPMHLVDPAFRSVNEPVQVLSRGQLFDFFGPDQPGYTLPQTGDGVLDQVQAGSSVKMVFVNVLDATSALVITPDTSAAQPITDGKLDIAGTISDGPNLTVFSPAGGSLGGPITYEEGRDYTVDLGNGIITMIPASEGGRMTEGEAIDLTYNLLTGGNYNYRTAESNTFTTDDTITLNPGLRNVNVRDSGLTTTYVEDTDYTVNYDTGVITRLTSGSISALEQVAIDYEFIDPRTVGDDQIIGSTGETRTGMQAFTDIFNLYGYVPRLLIAPFFSDRNNITSALETMADSLDSIAIVDAPKGTTYNDVIAGRGPSGTINFNYQSERLVGCYPWLKIFRNVTEQEENEPMSIRFAGVWANIVEERGWWWSPSSKDFNGIIGAERKLEYIPGNPNTEANNLNSVGITTYINYYGSGFKAFGNRNFSFPNSSEPTNFMNIKFAVIVVQDALRRLGQEFLDFPILNATIDALLDNSNAYIRTAVRQGGLIEGSRVYYDPNDNPAAQLANGQVVFRTELLPPPPAERITFLTYVNVDIAANLNVGRELIA